MGGKGEGGREEREGGREGEKRKKGREKGREKGRKEKKEKREKRAPALNMSFQHPVSQQDIWVTLDPATLI